MHRKIGGAEPARRCRATRRAGRCADDLQHRDVSGVERRCFGLGATGGKGRHGNDDGGPGAPGRGAKCGRLAILQACDDQRRRRQPARGSAAHSASIGAVSEASKQRAIKDDRDDGRPGSSAAGGGRERPRLSGQIAGMARHRCGAELPARRRHNLRGAATGRADFRGRLHGNSAATRRARRPAGSTPRQGAGRRDPRPAAPRARCRVRAPAPRAARHRISTSRARPGGERQ